MKLTNSNRALRQALNVRGLTSDQHRHEIERISEAHPHTIKFVAERADQTCVPYALGLTDDATYRAIAGWWNVFAGKEFMTWAIRGRLRETDEYQRGDLISYFSAAGWEHIGVISAPDRVTSKWGTYPLYEHGFSEVSEEYGDCVRFFRRLSLDEALSLFREFAHRRGISDDDIAEARLRWS